MRNLNRMNMNDKRLHFTLLCINHTLERANFRFNMPYKTGIVKFTAYCHITAAAVTKNILPTVELYLQ